jgi:multidrug resistance efflux pump
MKKFNLSFNVFYFFLWIIITSWVYYFFFMEETTQNTTNIEAFEVVKLWNIKTSISVPWTAQLVDEQSLKFTQAWKVVKVNYKEWEKINKWEIIAELDKSEWLSKVDDATIALDSAKLKLDQLYEVDDIKILNAEKGIESNKNDLLNSKKELEQLIIDNSNSLSDIKKAIEISETEYNNAIKNLELDKKDLELFKLNQTDSLFTTNTSLKTTIQSIEDNNTSNILDAEKTLEQLDYIFWVTEENKSLNDSYENYLSARNSSYLTEAKSYFFSAFGLYNALKTKQISYISWDIDTLKSILNDSLQMFDELYKATDSAYRAIDSSIVNISFTQSDIDSKKSNISSLRSSALSKSTSIKSNIDKLNTLTNVDLIVASNELAIRKKEDAINTTELALEKQKNDLETKINNYNSILNSNNLKVEAKKQSILLLEKTVLINKKDLEKTKEWPTDQEVKLAQNSVKQAEIKVQDAIDTLTNYELEAPFDWLVRKMDFQVGDNLDSNSEKFVYLENPNLLEINIMLDQIDIVKVHVWDKALITFDSYRDTEVEWEISLIDITPIISSVVVSFEVKIIITEDKFDKKIISWMTADIEVILEEKNDIILVSTTSITEKDWKKYVTIDKNWIKEEVEVTTGLVSLWNTEILTWLNLWDNIVTSDFKVNSTTETTQKATSIIWLPTWWWAWWTRNFPRD